MPGIVVRALASPDDRAAASWSGPMTDSMARARRGPTPETVWTVSNMSRSAAAPKP
jgi:hypothetical protein